MKNQHITVGEMARLYGISTQTLRYYDKIDLLKPVEVNEETGYRYYALRQCLILDVILYLKHIGTPLEDIAELIKSEIAIEKFREIIRKNKKAVEEKIKELEEINNLIDIKLDQLHEMEKITNFGEVYCKEIPKRSGLSVQVTEPNYTSESPFYEEVEYHRDVHYAGRVLTSIVEGSDYRNVECEWGFWGEIAENEKLIYPKFKGYFAITGNFKLEKNYPEHYFEIPEGRYVCTTYKGKMFSNKEAHEKIFEYVEKNKLNLDGFYYDSTLFTGYLTANRDDYIMELKFKIRDES